MITKGFALFAVIDDGQMVFIFADQERHVVGRLMELLKVLRLSTQRKEIQESLKVLSRDFSSAYLEEIMDMRNEEISYSIMFMTSEASINKIF